MNSYEVLPEGYEQSISLDLQKDKKLFLLVNGLGVLIGVVMVLLGCFHLPVLMMMVGSFWQVEFRLLAVGLCMVVYIVLHEAVHGVFMWKYSGKKPSFGFTLAYAYAGSEVYFAKHPYLVIALAPVVIWGLVLGVACALAPETWFWPIYFIQIANLSGAAGDLYVFWRFSRLPADILVQDTGVSMTVFTKKGVL